MEPDSLRDLGENFSRVAASAFNDLLEGVRSKRLRGHGPGQPRHGNKQVKERCHDDFNSFSKDIRRLNHQFDAFIRTVQPIGCSSLLIHTSRRLKEGMENILSAFKLNSAELWMEFPSVNPRRELPGDLQGSSAPSTLLDPHGGMDDLSERLSAFLGALHAIPEFSDEPLTDALLLLCDWLGYRARRIKMHIGSHIKEKIIILRYREQAMKEMSLHVSRLEVALRDFIEQGVKAIQNSEKKSQARLQNMSTVATFLSAVTATTMGYSMGEDRPKTASTVFGLWISSLILSIASAINAQLAIHWSATMYRSPRNALPIWASICFDHTPLVCLVGAVITFSTGLVAWTVAADLALAVRICTGTMTFATFLVLFTAILWEVRERRKEIRKDVEQDPRQPEPLMGVPAPSYTLQLPGGATNSNSNSRGRGLALVIILKSAATLFCTWRQQLTHLITRHFKADSSTRSRSEHDSTHGIGDVHSSSRVSMSNGVAAKDVVREGSLASDAFDAPDWEPMSAPTQSLNEQQKEEHHKTRTESSRSKLQGLVKGLKEDQAPDRPDNCRARPDELQSLRPLRRLPIFHSAGHDIHFSPDGKRLAVSRLNGHLAIWEVGKYNEKPTQLRSPVGRFAWSPDSSHIVVVMEKGLKTWSVASGRIANKQIEVEKQRGTPKSIAALTWLQSPSHFIAVNDDGIHAFDTQSSSIGASKVLQVRLTVHDVESIPHQRKEGYGFVFIVGTAFDEPPHSATKSRGTEKDCALAERLLNVVDLDKPSSHVVVTAPTLADARHVCISVDGMFALISYGDENCAELWRVQDGEGNIQLVFCTRFTPPDHDMPDREGSTRAVISGKARFCGELDAWAMATDGRSDIYIWHRATGQLLRTLRGAQYQDQFPDCGSISAVTSRVLRDYQMSLIIVSASTEGGVIMWEDPERETQQGQSSSGALDRHTKAS